MTPGTGTPDCVAPSIRTPSTCRQRLRVRTWLPGTLLSLSAVLTGCTTPPLVPDSRSGAHSGVTVTGTARSDSGGQPPVHATARRGHNHLPAVESRPSVPIDSAGVGMPEGDPARTGAELQSDDAAVGHGDTWARIRNGLRWPRPNNSRVARAIDWYRKHPAYLLRMTRRARPYLAYIVREVERRDMSMEFALLPVVESAFRELAYSPAGASGLWQFMPSTGKRYGLKQNWWYDGRRDVVESTRAALDYLTKLLREFDEDPLLAGRRLQLGRRQRQAGRSQEPGARQAHGRLVSETAQGNPGLMFPVCSPLPQSLPIRSGTAWSSNRFQTACNLRKSPLDRQIDLRVAADLAGITLRELRRLNPGFKRSATVRSRRSPPTADPVGRRREICRRALRCPNRDALALDPPRDCARRHARSNCRTIRSQHRGIDANQRAHLGSDPCRESPDGANHDWKARRVTIRRCDGRSRPRRFTA